MTAAAFRVRRFIAIAAVASIAIALLVASFVLRTSTVTATSANHPARFDHPPSAAAGLTPMMGPVGRSPLCGGPKSLEEAQAEVSFKILVPNHPLASAGNLTATYVCTDEVIIDFDSGIREVLEDQGDGAVPPWKDLAAQDSTMTLGVVRGANALLGDPSKDPSGQTPGGVELVENGILVAIAGNGKIALADLIDVMESLA
jgi:hypothetical protein